ncbi:MAG: glycosyltransferase family 4 protein [Elusimicrobia bacterium]|nr:glycosyltransferase family 4 protein [Elusimicrobiota bacterium]
MKVAFISESHGWSGGAAQILVLGRGLSEAGWQVTLCSPEGGEVARRAEGAGMRHVALHPRQDYDLSAAYRLAKLIDKEGIEVLHAHHPRGHAVGLASLYLSSRRPVFVVTRRVSFKVSSNPFSALKYRHPRIDGYIAVAENVRGELIAGGVAPERVETIPSGVDLQRFKPSPPHDAVRGELALPPGVPVIGKIANYSEWKGQDVVLDAAARLRRDGVRAVLVFAGRDTDSPELKARAKKAGVAAEDCRFLGFREDIPELLSNFTVSVNAARRGEGISGALRESLAMEVPAVASAAGGNAELVVEGVTGRMFEAGNDERLARVLKETLADLPAAKALARAGAEVVRERFSDKASVRLTMAYYARLAERQKANAG